MTTEEIEELEGDTATAFLIFESNHLLTYKGSLMNHLAEINYIFLDNNNIPILVSSSYQIDLTNMNPRSCIEFYMEIFKKLNLKYGNPVSDDKGISKLRGKNAEAEFLLKFERRIIKQRGVGLIVDWKTSESTISLYLLGGEGQVFILGVDYESVKYKPLIEADRKEQEQERKRKEDSEL